MAESNIKRDRGKALKAARKAAGLSARELIERANNQSDGEFELSVDSIYAYESGRVMLPTKVARRLANVLKIQASQLLVGDPEFQQSTQPEQRDSHTIALTVKPNSDSETYGDRLELEERLSVFVESILRRVRMNQTFLAPQKESKVE
jgi:transcriptional regulator with XRE-family HTH domain